MEDENLSPAMSHEQMAEASSQGPGEAHVVKVRRKSKAHMQSVNPGRQHRTSVMMPENEKVEGVVDEAEIRARMQRFADPNAIEEEEEAVELTETENEKFQTAFGDHCLKHHDGLDAHELSAAAAQLGLSLDPRSAAKIIASEWKRQHLPLEDFCIAMNDLGLSQQEEDLQSQLVRRRSVKDTVTDVALRNYFKLSDHAQYVVSRRWFDPFVVMCVVFVAFATGVELEAPRSSRLLAMKALHGFTLTAFTIEVVLKLVAQREHPTRYFTDKEEGTFNCFDFGVVFVSLAFAFVDGSPWRKTVMTLRLLRILKVLGLVPQLRVILLGLIAGVKAVSAIMLVQFLIMYIFAIVGCVLFKENDPGHFGGVGEAMLTLFRTATLADWVDIWAINYFGCELHDGGLYVMASNTTKPYIDTEWGSFDSFVCTTPERFHLTGTCYFVTYIVVTAYVILSLFISVITTDMFAVMDTAKELKMEDKLVNDSSEDNYKRREALVASVAEPDSDLNYLMCSFFSRDKKRSSYSDHFFSKLGWAPSDYKLYRRMLSWCERVSVACSELSHRPAFNIVICCTILFGGVLEGLEINGMFPRSLIQSCNYAVVAIFTAECFVKVAAEGNRPWWYFRERWNQFDFIIVLGSYLGIIQEELTTSNEEGASSFEMLLLLRLLRLLRVAKLLHSFPALRAVTQALLLSLANVSWVVAMLAMLNLFFALIAMTLFETNDPSHFGTLALSMVSIFQIETLDDWETLMYINALGCDKYGYHNVYGLPTSPRECTNPIALGWVAISFFCCVTVLGGIVMPTVLIGVVSVAFEESVQTMRLETAEEKKIESIFARASEWELKFQISPAHVRQLRQGAIMQHVCKTCARR
jgi:hypothetical protein